MGGAAVPTRWRTGLLLADRDLWSVASWFEDDDALLVVLEPPGRRTVLGCGDPRGVRRVVARHAEEVGGVDLATLPRLGAGPRGLRGTPVHEGGPLDADDDLPATVRGALGVEPATAWDRLVTTSPPGHPPSVRVRRLDLAAELDAVRSCLEQANPGSQADPAHPHEAAWFGVDGRDGLLGVVGATRRRGRPSGTDESWHLHGLGVVPGSRGEGLGSALTAAASVAAFEHGVDWVSLGMYADNAPARRVYERLGFSVEGRYTTYRPAQR